MKTEITYLQAFKLNNQISHYLKKEGFLDEKGFIDKPKTKMVTACKNILKQIDSIIEKYNNSLEDLKIDLALEDEKTKAILYNADGSYKFTKANLKTLNEKIKELQKEKVEIHQRFVEGSQSLLEDYDTFNNIFFNGVKVDEGEIITDDTDL